MKYSALKKYASNLALIALLLALTAVPALVGVGYGVLASVGYFRPAGESGFTLRHYAALWESGDLFRSLGFTLGIAVVATVLSFAVALLLAISVRGASRLNRWNRFLIQTPLPFPHLVVAVFTVLFLTQSGLVPRLLYALGLIASQESFTELVYDRFGIGILLVFLWKEVPFLAVVMLAVLGSASARYEAVAQSLGATPWQRFRFITLPVLTRGAVPSLVLVFTFIVGAFEVPLLVGPTYPPMLSVLTVQRYSAANLDFRGEAFALSTMIAALMILLTGIYAATESRKAIRKI